MFGVFLGREGEVEWLGEVGGGSCVGKIFVRRSCNLVEGEGSFSIPHLPNATDSCIHRDPSPPRYFYPGDERELSAEISKAGKNSFPFGKGTLLVK